jgi:O-acetyl-ADP-ribose deacetylase (regulator of RNase III)
MAGDKDPVEEVIRRARDVVRFASDAGWTGPPFDPLVLAEILKLPVTPREDVRDARTVPLGKEDIRIEFNPNRPAMRVRYSVAHEIAHTLFPDCAKMVRNRAVYHEVTGDDWQLEALCNVGAAEFLMPAGSMAVLTVQDVKAEQLREARHKFQVSTEALVIRVAKMSSVPCAAFCASRVEHGLHSGRHRLDYLIGSPTWSIGVGHGTLLPERSAVAECVAIGFTASRRERWPDGTTVAVECVAIPPYPKRVSPRVAGLAIGGHRAAVPEPLLLEVRGDAMSPRGEGIHIIAHIVNDATPNWGGGGFAAALARRYPTVQDDFREWVSRTPRALALGHTHFTKITERLGVFHMIAQHGYGPSPKPRIRYAALQNCLAALSATAPKAQAAIHMPRIGTGQAGGTWEVIRDMITETVCAQGLRVTVYDPPNRVLPVPTQPTLAFGTRY